MLQRQIMFKQLQELQKQQHLQELGDTMQCNYINQLSTIKSASVGQSPTLINGTPVHDTAQMFMAGNMNLVQYGTSPIVQGFPNGRVFSHAQSQALRSMAMVTQQLDVSLYGTPIASVGNNLNQDTHLQGECDDSLNMFTKSNGHQVEKPMTQSSAFGNFFMGDHCNVSSKQVCTLDGTFISQQVSQVATQGLNHGILPGNFEQGNFLQRNASRQEHGGREEQAGRPGAFPGKATGTGPSQNLASLDSLEQKILFSVDDNSWEVSFGKSNNSSTRGLYNTVEHGEYLNVFPSIQSGSWSALMQSAVSEASSSDTGLQEKWSGLSFQNPELSTENQPSDFVDSGKQQINWGDNNLGNASSLASKEFLLHNSNMSSSFHGSSLSGVQLPMNIRDGMCSDFSHESMQQSPEVASKYSDFNAQQKPLIEANQPVLSLAHLQRAWPGQTYGHAESDALQETALPDSGDPQCENLTARDAEPLTQSGITIQNFYDNKIALNKFWSDNVDEALHKDSNCLCRSNNDHVAGSVSVFEKVKSGKVNVMVDKECSLSNNFATVAKSSMDTFDQAVDQETRLSGDNCFQSENSNGSYCSNASHHTITGNRLKENVRLNGSDFQTQTAVNQKLSDPVGLKLVTCNRFLHLIERKLRANFEPVDNVKHFILLQVLCQQVPQELSGHEQAYTGQFKFIGNVSSSGRSLEKGHSPDIQSNTRVTEEILPTNNVAFFDRLPAFQGPNVTYQTRQNMLEVLNKVVKSREDGTGTIAVSTDSTPLSELPQAAVPDGSGVQSHNKPSASQCFGLRLGTPIQPPNSYGLYSSQSASQKGNLIAEIPSDPPYLRNQLQNENLPAASITHLSPQMLIPGMARRFTAINPGTPWDASCLINTNLYGQQCPVLNTVPVTQASQARFTAKPSNVWTNVSTRQHVSGTEHGRLPFSLLSSLGLANSTLETASGAPLELNDHNLLKPCNSSQEIGESLMNLQGSDYGKGQSEKESFHQKISLETLEPASQVGRLSHGQECVASSLSETNSAASGALMTNPHQQGSNGEQLSDNKVPAISTSDFEDFARSLKPNLTDRNYSMLHQLHSMKNAGTDPSKRVSARNLINNEHNTSRINLFSSGNNKMVSFASAAIANQPVQASFQPLLQDASEETIKVGPSNSQSYSSCNNLESNKTVRSQINLQIAPSRFNRGVTLKNGQIFPMYDVRAANDTQQFSLVKPFETLQMSGSTVQVNPGNDIQVNNILPSATTTAVATKQLSSPYISPPDVTSQNLSALRTKKRKISAYELLPWHKEVIQGSHRSQRVSKAQIEWAHATNRLIERVDNEAERNEDMKLIVRPKKRLNFTTQLMQQLFQPVPLSILSADSTSNCDTMAYSTARLTLGDACSQTRVLKSSDTCDMDCEKSKMSQRVGDQYFSKLVEDFISRVKKLEDDFLRLDKEASILDIRMESQELEKFSVINRFAKFHIRGQAGAAETSYIGTTPALKPTPRRYVIALPMPRNVPEGTYCLSL